MVLGTGVGRMASRAVASWGVMRVNERFVRDRFGALRNLVPFLGLIWRTSPGLTAATVVLRLARAVLPLATLFVGKLIIDQVVGLSRLPERPADVAAWLASGLLFRLSCCWGRSLCWPSRRTGWGARSACWTCCCRSGSATSAACT
jgi:hypothetical protein